MLRRTRLVFSSAIATGVLVGIVAFVPNARGADGDTATQGFVQAFVTSQINRWTPSLPPLGSIIAYVPIAGRTLDDRWTICDGRNITDPTSPLNGTTLPNLTDDRFLMGTANPAALGVAGGSNELTSDGNHSHGGYVGAWEYRQGEINYSRGGGRQDQFSHHHSISADGQHNHGGDKRPKFHGVQWIMRIK